MRPFGYKQARAVTQAKTGAGRDDEEARRRTIAGVGVGLLATLLAILAFGVRGVQAQPEELPLGTKMPAVSATFPSVSGGDASVSSLTGSTATVFVFWSNQCPWVDKYEGRIQQIARDVQGQGVNVVLVNANDASAFPKESMEASRERAESAGYVTTYVRDPNAALARALGASRTPHVFVFDASQTLVYAGTIDDSPGDASNVSKPYLRDALAALTSGEEISVADTKAFGCTIKFPGQ